MNNYINAFGGEGTILARAFVLMNAFGLIDDTKNNICTINTFDFATKSHDFTEVSHVIDSYSNVAKYKLPFTCNVPITKGNFDLKNNVVSKCFNDTKNMSVQKVYITEDRTNPSIVAKTENMRGSFSDDEILLNLEEGLYGNLRIGNTIYEQLRVNNAFAKSGLYNNYDKIVNDGLNIFSLGGFKGGGTGATLIPIEIQCYNKYLQKEKNIPREKYKSYRITSLPYSKYLEPDNKNEVKSTLEYKYYFPKSGNLLKSLDKTDNGRLKHANQTTGYDLDAAIFVSGIGGLDYTATYGADNQCSDLHGVNLLAALSMIQIMNDELDETALNGKPLLFNIDYDSDEQAFVSYKNLSANKTAMQRKITNVCRFATVIRYVLLPTLSLKKEDFCKDLIAYKLFQTKRSGLFGSKESITDEHFNEISDTKNKLKQNLKQIDDFYQLVIEALQQMLSYEHLKQMQGLTAENVQELENNPKNFAVELVNGNFINQYLSVKSYEGDINADQCKRIRVDMLEHLSSISELATTGEAFAKSKFDGASIILKIKDSPEFNNICEGSSAEADVITRNLLEKVFKLIQINE